MNSYDRAIIDFLTKPENYRVLFDIRPYINKVLQRKLRERQENFINRLNDQLKSYPALDVYSTCLDENGSWVRFSNQKSTDGIEFIIEISMADQKNCWFGLRPIGKFTPELNGQTQALFPLAPYADIRYRYFDRPRIDLYDPDATEADLNALFDDWIKQFLATVAKLDPYLTPASKWKMKRKEPFNIDAGDNQDWTKQSWDLPPYKSEEFFEFIGEDELDHFRKLPVYSWAVKNGLIKDDEWCRREMKPMRLPNGNLLIPKRLEEEGIIGDGMIEISLEEAEFQMWDDYLKKVEKEEQLTKYFAKIVNNMALVIARLRIESNIHYHERWSWQEKQWVGGSEVFREMSGIGGDGYDWEEVTKEQAEKLIKSRND